VTRGGKDKDRESGPDRKCIATGEVRPKAELIRFVVGPDDQLVPDLAGKLPGRGIWVTATRAALETACADFAAARGPVALEELMPDSLGRFLALLPVGDTTAIDNLAFEAVRAFDGFRAPLTDTDIARRRQSRLSPRQDTLLQRWGYPFLGPEFRFHITLTGRLARKDIPSLLKTLQEHLPPRQSPYLIRSVALVGERTDGFFEMIRRFPLGS